MVELILILVLVLVVLGVVCYLTHNIFSKNTKEFHVTIGQNGIEIQSTFYKRIILRP